MPSIYACTHILLYFLALFIITIDTRAVNDNDAFEVIVNDLSNDGNKQVDILLTNYRHRFEHSTNVKKLRWTMDSQSDRAFCDFCDLVVSVVKYNSNPFLLSNLFLQARLLIEINQTEHVEEIINTFCKEFKLIDVEVCTGAVHEYQVNSFSEIKKNLFDFSIGYCCYCDQLNKLY